MKLLTFDYETTSNQPQSTRGVQIAAICVDLPDDKADLLLLDHTPLLNEITNPEVDIHHEAAQIHGISNEVARAPDKRVDHIASKELYDFIYEHRDEIILNTHNGTTFDAPILWRLAAMNSDRPRPKLDLPHIDTLVMATRCWPNAPNHKLSLTQEEADAKSKKEGKPVGVGLIQWLGLGSGEGAHDALEDIRMVLTLTDHVRKKLRDGELSFQEIAQWCATPRVLKVCHFGKHKGKEWGKGPGCVPAGYVAFICDKFEDTTPDMIATIQHHYGMRFKRIRS